MKKGAIRFVFTLVLTVLAAGMVFTSVFAGEEVTAAKDAALAWLQGAVGRQCPPATFETDDPLIAVSSYTYENALFSKRAADMAGLCIKRAILCCKNYHTRRAWMYYHTVFPEADILVCPSQVDDITKENWTLSEKGIHEVMAELNRVIVQFSLMM